MLNYNLDQISVFTESIYKLKNDDMFSIRAAVWADENDFKNLTQTSKVSGSKVREPQVPEGWITK